ncbi:MAG: YihY/virulence factor BrkB family protein, partial [Phycisphaerae bacterium]|nr:YihY/virulence factor BrkB family protein [Phycisphaerae bacterium]
MKHLLIPDWLRRLLTTPTAELSRWQYAARFLVELCRQGARQLREDQANQMAAALAFRTIFGLVPVIIIAMLLFRSFGGAELFADMVGRVLAAAKLDQIASPDESLTLAEWARDMVVGISSNIRGRAIGLIGALVLGWAAIGLLTTIERSFNRICRSTEHRSLARRIPLYWTTITIGPALLYISFHFERRFTDMIQQADAWGPLASIFALATSFLPVWVLMLCLYTFVPHAKVKLSARAAGAFVATVLWTAATYFFKWYVAYSFSKESSAFTILYGSLGLIPLFLLWIYFVWLVVLYGLEITSVLNIVGGRMDKGVPVRGEMPVVMDPAAVVPLMQAVAERFRGGLSTRPSDIVEATRFSPRAVDLMLSSLADAGVLH